MSIRKLLVAAGVAGTLGTAAPALADWYQPAPPVVVQPPAYAYGDSGYYGQPGVYYRRGWDGDGDGGYWRARRWHEWRERQRAEAWRRHEWREHHGWDRW